MLNTIRSLMAEQDIDFLIIFSADPHLSEYTGRCDRYRAVVSRFTGSAGELLISREDALLWTDSRYFVQAAGQLEGSGIRLMKSGMPDVPSLEDYLKEHVWEGQTIAFDLKTVSYDRYCSLKDAMPDSVTISDASSILKEAVEMPPRAFSAIEQVPYDLAGKSVSEKLADVRNRIRKNYLKSENESFTYILSDLTSIMWLFNLRGSDIDFVPVAYSYAMINAHYAVLYVSRKNLPKEVAASLADDGVSVKEYSCFYSQLADIASDVVLIDPYMNNSETVSCFENTGLYRECSDCILIRKAVKNRKETEGMRSAHLKDAVTMIRFIKRIKEMAEEGTLSNEYEIAATIDDMRLKGGATSLSFKTICAYAENAAKVHYSPQKDSSKKVTGGKMLLVDSGGHYKFEGTTDITRTISTGPVDDEIRKAYTTVLKGNLQLMDTIFPQGYEGTMLDVVAEKPLWDAGYFCGHGIGHGVGCYLSVHESEARISRKTGKREIAFVPGVIVSDEPGIYIEGHFGIRLENLLLTVAADSIDGYKMCAFEPLTLVPFDRESIDISLLSEKEMTILNRYNGRIWEKVSPMLDEDEKNWLKENIDIK